MSGGHSKLVLIAFIIGFGGFCEAAKLEGFSRLNPIKPASVLASKPARSQFSLAIQSQSPKDIKDAVIWHAPPRRYLAKKLNEAETKELDTLALEILIQGLSLHNIDFANASKKSSSKNRIVLKLADIIQASDNQGISQIGEYINQSKTEADNYLRKTLAQTYHEYSLTKKLFDSKIIRDTISIKQATDARSNLVYLCGIEAVEEAENLWRRN